MINGIDVSIYQGTVDWSKVKAAGYDFVFVRLGWAGWDGRIVANGGLDKNFAQNVTGATAAGMKVGVYLYSYCKTAAAAAVAASEALALVKDYTLEYPVAFDMEDTSDSGVRYDRMSRAENTRIAKAFLDTVQSGGYYAMLYTYKSFAESYLNMADLSVYDLWLAQFASAPTYSGPYGIWQYSESGSVPGIAGKVDLDTAYKDYAAVIRAAGLNGLTGEDAGDSDGDGGDGGEPAVDLAARVQELEKALKSIQQTASGAL